MWQATRQTVAALDGFDGGLLNDVALVSVHETRCSAAASFAARASVARCTLDRAEPPRQLQRFDNEAERAAATLLRQLRALHLVPNGSRACWDASLPLHSPVQLLRAFANRYAVRCKHIVCVLGLLPLKPAPLQGAAETVEWQTRRVSEERDRVAIVQSLFARTIDLEHFRRVLHVMHPQEQVPRVKGWGLGVGVEGLRFM